MLISELYAIKFLLSGIIERLRTWLVAKGYTHIYGVDYFRTYFLVARLHSAWNLYFLSWRSGLYTSL